MARTRKPPKTAKPVITVEAQDVALTNALAKMGTTVEVPPDADFDEKTLDPEWSKTKMPLPSRMLMRRWAARAFEEGVKANVPTDFRIAVVGGFIDAVKAVKRSEHCSVDARELMDKILELFAEESKEK